MEANRMKLKPCLKCRSKNIVLEFNSLIGLYIRCLNCETTVFTKYFAYDEKDKFIDWWNNRPSKWITVCERLPKKIKDSERSIDCLVLSVGLFGKDVYKAYYHYDYKKWYISNTDISFTNAIAWQHLPIPPEAP